MIDDAPGEEQLLLAEVDILQGLAQAEVQSLAARSPIVHLSKGESLTLGEDPPGILLLVSEAPAFAWIIGYMGK